ncbi:MAG: YraN family protein [Candidatus Vogelbacteria bacterium]|nr:YraN family protein [Candidatus Vogelbacteria bacterium]
MSQTTKQTIGKKGEDLAIEFLKKQDYEILDRNYWQKWGEIDIVAKKDGIIHFVEVKTVSRDHLLILNREEDFYEPEDNLHPWKLRRLARAVETYLLDKKVSDDIDWQTDAISIYLDHSDQLLKIDYLPNITL